MSSIFTVPELVIGVGLSEAASSAFEPKVEVPKQAAWVANPQRVPDLGLIAQLVAGGKITPAAGHNMANRLGFSSGTMDSLVWLAQNRLSFPILLRMWRLAAVNPAFNDSALSALFDKTIAHEQLDWDYRPYLRALKTAELPGIGDIAYGVVRGMLPAPSWVPVAPPTTTTKVKRFPQVPIDPVKLAAALGYDEDMLKLMVGRSGLSLAPGLAAQAYFRSIIADDDYHLAIAEGDLRTEWANVLRDASRQILTAGEYAELELRGFVDAPTRRGLTALHGMSDVDSDRLFDVKGRAPAVHAITTGLARGATYPSDYSVVPEPYKAAIQRSDIRPEFADIVYHDRYTYPSGFQIRAETQNGTLTQAAAEQILLEVGWKPQWATFFSTAWSGGTTTGGDKHVAKAQTQLWTTTHKSYIGYEISAATATTALEAAGVGAAAVPAVLNLWNEERSLIRKSLTATQIRKALNQSDTNPATGQPWTHADAMARLLQLGYDQADATVFLEE